MLINLFPVNPILCRNCLHLYLYRVTAHCYMPAKQIFRFISISFFFVLKNRRSAREPADLRRCKSLYFTAITRKKPGRTPTASLKNRNFANENLKRLNINRTQYGVPMKHTFYECSTSNH